MESEVAIKWLSKNKMIVNTDKFKSIILTRNKYDIPTVFPIIADIVSIEGSVNVLGIQIQNRFNAYLHINTFCKLVPTC